MKNTQKIFTSIFLGLMLVTVFTMVDIVAAAGPVDQSVASNNYQGNMNAGDDKNFKFQNRFQVRLQTNCSAEVAIDTDVEEMGDREFSLQLNTSSGQKLTVMFQANNSELAVENGSKIQTKAQNKYQNRERFMVNLSLSGTDPIQAKLALKTADGDAKWAYFDETSEEWVEVDTTYEDGFVTAETDHFSVWMVLTPEEPTIDGFPLFLGFAMLSVIGIIAKMRKR